MPENPLRRPAALLLCPTDFELRHFIRQRGFDASAIPAAICGFGPIAAAARTAQLIARHQPSCVLLAGIAGTYSRSRLDVGQAACFERVASFGIGIGTADAFIPASTLGFAQWPGEHGGELIEESIALTIPQAIPAAELLLTCCAASSTRADVQHRLSQCPSALAEDMEGFGAAMACRLSDTPLIIIRGIANEAGDRDKRCWKVESALDEAWRLIRQALDAVQQAGA